MHLFAQHDLVKALKLNAYIKWDTLWR